MGSKDRQGYNRVGLIQSLKKGAGFLFALIVCLASIQSQAQSTVRINFDGPPEAPPGSSVSLQNYYELGMSFTPIVTQGTFSRVGPGYPSDPQNSTAYLRAALTQTLKSAFTNGWLFSLVSVELAEYSTLFQTPLTVRFVGYRFDGSTVTTDLTTDGIIDGTGPLPDFETFNFGSEWSGLSRVEIPTALWSLDNLVVSVPEPGTWALLIMGGGLFIWFRPKR